jgi:hypothetical protein
MSKSYDENVVCTKKNNAISFMCRDGLLLQLVENGMNVKEIWTHYKVVSAFRLTCKGSRLASAMLLKPGDTCPQISPA